MVCEKLLLHCIIFHEKNYPFMNLSLQIIIISYVECKKKFVKGYTLSNIFKTKEPESLLNFILMLPNLLPL